MKQLFRRELNKGQQTGGQILLKFKRHNAVIYIIQNSWFHQVCHHFDQHLRKEVMCFISTSHFNLHSMPRVVFVVSLFLYFTLICVLPVVFAFVHTHRPVHPCRAHPLCSQCTGVSYNSFLPWLRVVFIEFVFVFVSVFLCSQCNGADSITTLLYSFSLCSA